MVERINDYIYRIQVRLPGNPLRNLNSYAVIGKERNLLIDTGFNLPETYKDLSSGIEEIGLDMNRTDIFLTHHHADHTGLVSRVATGDSRVYINEPDGKQLRDFLTAPHKVFEDIALKLLESGFPKEELRASLEISPAIKSGSEEYFETLTICDGQSLDIGGVALRAISTPGHSPGHMCLYIEKDLILFTGDHVLYDITPNITHWSMLGDALGDYLANLDVIAKLDVKLGLPAHREVGDFHVRIEELKHHHMLRLREVEGILAERPGLSCYEVALSMAWSIRSKTWEDFPLSQKTFAVGEASAHIVHLEKLGRVTAEVIGGSKRYRLAG